MKAPSSEIDVDGTTLHKFIVGHHDALIERYSFPVLLKGKAREVFREILAGSDHSFTSLDGVFAEANDPAYQLKHQLSLAATPVTDVNGRVFCRFPSANGKEEFVKNILTQHYGSDLSFTTKKTGPTVTLGVTMKGQAATKFLADYESVQGKGVRQA